MALEDEMLEKLMVAQGLINEVCLYLMVKKTPPQIPSAEMSIDQTNCTHPEHLREDHSTMGYRIWKCKRCLYMHEEIISVGGD